jgi:hypothetical protein
MTESSRNVNLGYLLLIAIVFSFLLILSQRMVSRHKRTFRGFIVTMGILLMIRYEFQAETLIGYFIALLISVLFWILIGRYNQLTVEEEESIRVYGLDD